MRPRAAFNEIVQEDELISQINVTPLVDITLVLLIIFMLTATLVIAPSMNVDLPMATKGEGSPSTALSITITEDKRIYLSGKLVSETELKNEIIRLQKEDSEMTALIAADKNAAHGDFIKIVDLLQSLGIESFAIQVKVRDE